jgi:hypothetical protein
MWHCKQASDSKFELTLWWKTLHSHTNESKFQHKLCSGLSIIQACRVFDDEGVGVPSDLKRRISGRPILTWGFASLGLRASPSPPSSWFTSCKISALLQPMHPPQAQPPLDLLPFRSPHTHPECSFCNQPRFTALPKTPISRIRLYKYSCLSRQPHLRGFTPPCMSSK